MGVGVRRREGVGVGEDVVEGERVGGESEGCGAGSPLPAPPFTAAGPSAIRSARQLPRHMAVLV